MASRRRRNGNLASLRAVVGSPDRQLERPDVGVVYSEFSSSGNAQAAEPNANHKLRVIPPQRLAASMSRLGEKPPSRYRSYRILTAPSAQIANAANTTTQMEVVRKNGWPINRTISSIAQPIAAKMAAAAMKSAPVQRTSSVNNIATAGRMSKTPENVHRGQRQLSSLAVRGLADTVTDMLVASPLSVDSARGRAIV